MMTTQWLEELEGLEDEQREQAVNLEKRREGDGERWLLSEGIVEPEKLLWSKSRFFQLPMIRLAGYHPSEEATAMISEEQARKLNIFPLFCLEELIYVAMSDPDDLRCEDFVRKLTGHRVKAVLATEDDIRKAITRWYLTSQKGRAGLLQRRFETLTTSDVQEEDLVDRHAPAIKEVEKILAQAIRLGASDVHLEPDEEQVFMRYRVDGVLHDYSPPALELFPAIVSRIKILSNLDIAEKRLPQDGRASIEVDRKSYDLRVSLLPNVHGEGVCIRILNPDSTRLSLTEMGFDASTLERYDRVVARPHGIVLVTGPTGSGKSTTLYATLNRIESREVKTITLEDPVEYKLPGIVQVAIKAEIGYTFAVGLKAILRHDPDIVMLGEIRDLESAEIAFRAALTGHLLFSTLHTNSAALAVTRLLDMGVPSFQVMAALNGVLAQRLVRRLCPACKAPVEATPDELKALGVAGGEFFGPVGCAECQDIGYKGRTAIHEFLEITPEMRRLEGRDLTAPVLEELAAGQGFETLREAALKKVQAGITSIAEALSVTGGV